MRRRPRDRERLDPLPAGSDHRADCRAAQTAAGDFRRLKRSIAAVTRVLRVDDTLADTELVPLAWTFHNVARPEFVTAPVEHTTVENRQEVQHLDQARAGAPWSHLRDDSLSEHLDEFR